MCLDRSWGGFLNRACEEASAPCWPIPSAAVTPVSSSQPFITTVEKADDGEDSEDGANESRTVGSRGTRSYASRMERKATREKMRRLELNDKFNELAEVRPTLDRGAGQGCVEMRGERRWKRGSCFHHADP